MNTRRQTNTFSGGLNILNKNNKCCEKWNTRLL